ALYRRRPTRSLARSRLVRPRSTWLPEWFPTPHTSARRPASAGGSSCADRISKIFRTELRELWLARQKLTGRMRPPRAAARKLVLAWSLVTWSRPRMDQHPKLTLEWALRGLERALSDLED